MKEIILYRNKNSYYVKQQSFSSLDFLKGILEEFSAEDCIKDLLNPAYSATIGDRYGAYKEGNIVFIYYDICYEFEGEEKSYAYRQGLALTLNNFITIIRKYDQLEKEQWDEIILQQDEHNNITLFGRNYDPDIPIVMHFCKDPTEDHEYDAECAYGRYEEIRLYFIYETLHSAKWLAFLKNSQKKKFKGSTLYAQKVANEVHLSYFNPSVQKKHNVVPDKIDIAELIRLTNEWLELSKKGAESITLTILHDMFQLQEG